MGCEYPACAEPAAWHLTIMRTKAERLTRDVCLSHLVPAVEAAQFAGAYAVDVEQWADVEAEGFAASAAPQTNSESKGEG